MADESESTYKDYEFPPDFEPKFVTSSNVAHSEREFYLTFGCLIPHKKKIKAVAQLIVTPQHLLELMVILNRQ